MPLCAKFNNSSVSFFIILPWKNCTASLFFVCVGVFGAKDSFRIRFQWFMISCIFQPPDNHIHSIFTAPQCQLYHHLFEFNLWTGHFLFAFVFSIKHRFTFHIEIFQFGQQTELKLNTKHINSHEFAYSNALWLNVKMSLTQHPHRFSWFSYFALKCQKSFSMEIDRETRCDSTTPLTCYRLDSHIRIHRNSINCLLITISTQFAFEFSDSVLLNEI